MSIATQEIYKNNPINVHEYNQLADELNDSISDIEMHVAVLTDSQTARLHTLITAAQGKPSFDATEIDKQYHLLLSIQEQVVDMSGTLRATASIRDIASIIGSMNSLISLFLKAEAQLDSIKAEADLKEAVLEAMAELPEKNRAKFFDKLKELS